MKADARLEILGDDLDLAHQRFNQDAEWAVRRKAPFGTALNRQGLATFAVGLPGLFEF
ncbi:MAG: hypothetical protein HY985_12805 [Magnetospirillum sp.]|nr:hypothetical protein [Magnetospirillum sp.]